MKHLHLEFLHNSLRKVKYHHLWLSFSGSFSDFYIENKYLEVFVMFLHMGIVDIYHCHGVRP